MARRRKKEKSLLLIILECVFENSLMFVQEYDNTLLLHYQFHELILVPLELLIIKFKVNKINFIVAIRPDTLK